MTTQRGLFLAVGLAVVGAIAAKGFAAETPAMGYRAGQTTRWL